MDGLATLYAMILILVSESFRIVNVKKPLNVNQKNDVSNGNLTKKSSGMNGTSIENKVRVWRIRGDHNACYIIHSSYQFDVNGDLWIDLYLYFIVVYVNVFLLG